MNTTHDHVEQGLAPTVLLVEDEPALHEAAKLKLTQAGITVVSATSGEQALKVLETTRPNLVWLDILLPGMNGLEVLRRIRHDEKLKDLPVVIVSVSAGPEKIKQAFGLNVVDYIVKSDYTIETLVGRVREIIHKIQ